MTFLQTLEGSVEVHFQKQHSQWFVFNFQFFTQVKREGCFVWKCTEVYEEDWNTNIFWPLYWEYRISIDNNCLPIACTYKNYINIIKSNSTMYPFEILTIIVAIIFDLFFHSKIWVPSILLRNRKTNFIYTTTTVVGYANYKQKSIFIWHQMQGSIEADRFNDFEGY